MVALGADEHFKWREYSGMAPFNKEQSRIRCVGEGGSKAT